MNNLLDILSNSNKDIDNQKLMDYINGKLNEEEKHLIEAMLMDNEFENDAADGLQSIKNKEGVNNYVSQLNKDLKNYIATKKDHREKRKIVINQNTIIAIIFIIALAILVYVVISKL